MRGHHGRDAGVECVAERREILPLELRGIEGHGRERRVRIRVGAAVPGKCFAHAITPSDWHPSIHSATRAPTRAGSPPAARVPMIGLPGATSRSHTGASAQLRPARLRSRAVTWPARRISGGVVEVTERAERRERDAAVELLARAALGVRGEQQRERRTRVQLRGELGDRRARAAV